jgi:hypothetical protein
VQSCHFGGQCYDHFNRSFHKLRAEKIAIPVTSIGQNGTGCVHRYP